MEGHRTRVFSCRLHEESWQKFRRAAKQYGWSQSDLLEELVRALPEPRSQEPRFVVRIEENAAPAHDPYLRNIVVGGG